jgi:hypothetical protein
MQTRTMKLNPAPPFILSSGLLLWGWENNFLIFAIPMAIILETANWADWRWPITDKEFNNLADLSGVGFFIVVIYVFTDVGAKGIYTILAIMPFILFLLLAVQLYSESGTLKMSALFVSLRKNTDLSSSEANKSIDISLPYFMICLLSASAGDQYAVVFFVIVCTLITIILYTGRSHRVRVSVWIILMSLAISLAYGTQQGVRQLQRYVEGNFMEMFDRVRWRYRDPNRASTAIGSIGRLKFSDKILVRIDTGEQSGKSLYLREASYNQYNYGSWNTSEPLFNVIDEDILGDSWAINNIEAENTADLSYYMLKLSGVIPLLQGTEKIHGAGIVEINKNNFGTINMEIREGWVQYSADYNSDLLGDPPPTDDDLYIGSNYVDLFEGLADELSLPLQNNEEDVVRIVEEHFRSNFTYSLDSRRRFTRGNYLKNFLFEDRTGHCEYFATTTALLLRAAGIPTRYAVGYTTNEYSAIEGQYIARSRDAHSWVLAYVNDRWIRIDTTPSIWSQVDAENASIFRGISDLWAWASYRYDLFISKDELEAEESNLNILWLLIPLFIILFWRLYFKERISKNSQINLPAKKPNSGADSEFYIVIDRLNKLGFNRQQGETLYQWIRRIKPNIDITNILHALELHYRYRFDPEGIDDKEKELLNDLVMISMNDLK